MLPSRIPAKRDRLAEGERGPVPNQAEADNLVARQQPAVNDAQCSQPETLCK